MKDTCLERNVVDKSYVSREECLLMEIEAYIFPLSYDKRQGKGKLKFK